MLGRFLELGLHAPQAGESFEAWRRLGFEPALTGDVWPHAYGVVTCEGLALGLHGSAPDDLCLYFVRPNVASLHRDLAARGVPVTSAVLGHDAFNRLDLQDPTGVRLTVLEARSFSPPTTVPAETLLGRFWRLSLPARDPQRAGAFWRQLGLPTAELGEPWPALAIGAELPLAYHSRRQCPEPALLFRHRDPRAAAGRLAAHGLEPGDDPLRLRSRESQLLLVLA